MIKEYSFEEIQQLLKTIPAELKESFSSEETEKAIWNTCEKNGINEVAKVTKLVGYVLLGLLLPEEFQKVLEADLGLSEEIAKVATRELNRFVFYPVKPALDQLHGKEVDSTERIITETIKTKTTKDSREDKYRETIE